MREGRVDGAKLLPIAKKLGSDCALFLYKSPVLMRGRGEDVELIDFRCVGGQLQKIVVFKPSFSINTAWAYGEMKKANGKMYVSAEEGEAIAKECITALREGSLSDCNLFNNMELAVFDKYISLGVALKLLREEYGIKGRMSGSGSACFLVMPEKCSEESGIIIAKIKEFFRKDTFVIETRLLPSFTIVE